MEDTGGGEPSTSNNRIMEDTGGEEPSTSKKRIMEDTGGGEPSTSKKRIMGNICSKKRGKGDHEDTDKKYSDGGETDVSADNPDTGRREVHQTFIHNRGVHEGNVGNLVTGDWNRGDMHGNTELNNLQVSEEELKSLTEGMVEVSAVDMVVKKFKAGHRWVTITGNAGDGKSTVGYLVLRSYRTKDMYMVNTAEELSHVSNLRTDCIILVNDIFGMFTFDKVAFDKCLPHIKRMLQTHERAAENHKPYVLLISRWNVLQSARDHLGRLVKILDEQCVVNLGELKVEEEQRLHILNYHLERKKIPVAESVKQRVVTHHAPHGFPHCCKMYAELSKDQDINIEEFFTKPLEFLDETTSVLLKTPDYKILFQTIIKNGGSLAISNISDDTERDKLTTASSDLKGSYIQEISGAVQFSHPSIYESVMNIIGQKDILFIIKYASLSVLRQKVHIKDHDNDVKSGYLNINKTSGELDAFAKRFQKDILSREFYVFRERFCDSRDFCKSLLNTCVNTNPSSDEVKKTLGINDKKLMGDTMLWTAVWSGRNAAVHVLVEHGADVNKTNYCGQTPLQYLCEWGNADVSTIQLLISHGADISAKGGFRKQTPLHCLCKSGNADVRTIQLLISHGASVSGTDDDGQTPLHCLCKSGKADVSTIQLLISHGAAINKADWNGTTPHHYLSARVSEEELESLTEGMVEVSAVDMVVKKFKAGHRWVTITGNAGDGKSTVGYLVLHSLKCKDIYKVKTPYQLEYVLQQNPDCIVLDDIFGMFTFDKVAFDKCLPHIKRMLQTHENHKPYVLLISRWNVLQSARDHLGELVEILDEQCVVNLGELKVEEERLRILNYHLDRKHITIPEAIKQRVVTHHAPHGFPHCCKMYVELSKDQDINIEDFFTKPLEFLDQTMKVLMGKAEFMDLFKAIIKHDGDIDISNINDDKERERLTAALKITGSCYVQEISGAVHFSHPSIYESVMNIIGQKDILFIIKYASLSVLRQKVHIKDHDNDVKSGYWNINKMSGELDALAKRFQNKLLSRHFDVFKERFCDSPDFCRSLLKTCVNTNPSSDEYIVNTGNKKPQEQEPSIDTEFNFPFLHIQLQVTETLGINDKEWLGDTMLWTALMSERNAAVHVLVEHGANVNKTNNYGQTPLHCLCERGNADVSTIQLLISHGADVNAKAGYMNGTPLHCLCESGNADVSTIQLLISHGADVNAKAGYMNWTPLHRLCQSGNADVSTIQLLISHGANVSGADVNGQTPLHCLCKSGNADVSTIQLLIENGANVSATDWMKYTPLDYLCMNGPVSDDVAQMLTT